MDSPSSASASTRSGLIAKRAIPEMTRAPDLEVTEPTVSGTMKARRASAPASSRTTRSTPVEIVDDLLDAMADQPCASCRHPRSEHRKYTDRTLKDMVKKARKWRPCWRKNEAGLLCSCLDYKARKRDPSTAPKYQAHS